MNQPTEYLKYHYTDQEIAEAARELANANRKRSSLEQRKKEVDSAIKAEIECENSIIGRLSNLIGTGFEYRDIPVTIELDTPEVGKKRIVRLDTGEEVSVKPMTDSDRQMVLDLQTKAEAAEAEAQKAREPIITPPPMLTALPEPEVMSAAEVAAEGPTLAPAPTMGGTHQRESRKQRGKRNPEAEALADGWGLEYADGSAEEPAE